jgi:hypothetical protein
MGKSSTISNAEWALAKRRARVLAELVANKECSHAIAIINQARAALRLSRAMMFRLLARYKEDQRTSALLPKAPGRTPGTSVLGKEREEIISAQIRKFYLTREKRPVGSSHPGPQKSPRHVSSAAGPRGEAQHFYRTRGASRSAREPCSKSSMPRNNNNSAIGSPFGLQRSSHWRWICWRARSLLVS